MLRYRYRGSEDRLRDAALFAPLASSGGDDSYLGVLLGTSPAFLWVGDDASGDLTEHFGGPPLEYQSGVVAYRDVTIAGVDVVNAENGLFSTTDSDVLAAGASDVTLSWIEEQSGGHPNAEVMLYLGNTSSDGIGLYCPSGGVVPAGRVLLGAVGFVGATQTTTSGAVVHKVIRHAAGTTTYWIDGVEVATASLTPNDPTTGFSVFLRGNSGEVGTKAFIAIHDSALSDEAISALVAAVN